MWGDLESKLFKIEKSQRNVVSVTNATSPILKDVRRKDILPKDDSDVARIDNGLHFYSKAFLEQRVRFVSAIVLVGRISDLFWCIFPDLFAGA
jgi:hypothetical protein